MDWVNAASRNDSADYATLAHTSTSTVIAGGATSAAAAAAAAARTGVSGPHAAVNHHFHHHHHHHRHPSSSSAPPAATTATPHAHSHAAEFSTLVNGLLAPLPTSTNMTTAEWPASAMANTRADPRHDLRFEFSLSAGPDFDTDQLDLRDADIDDAADDDEDDDELSTSDMRGAVSSSEETSVVTESAAIAGVSKLSIGKQEHSHTQTQTQQTKSSTSSLTNNTITNSQDNNSNPTLMDNNNEMPLSATTTTGNMSVPLPTPTSASPSISQQPRQPPPPHQQQTLQRRAATQIAPKSEAMHERQQQGRKRQPGAGAGGSRDGLGTVTVAGSGTASGGARGSSTSSVAKVIAKRRSGAKSVSCSALPNVVGSRGKTVVGTSVSTSQSSGGLSHTKLCRDRLNNMFDRLKHTLPPAPPGVEVKHKAQVLDYAILVFKNMVERTSQLEIELAVSSNKATMEWISKLVTRTQTFPEAAEEVMRLFVRRRGWLHAELWNCTKKSYPSPASATMTSHTANSSSDQSEQQPVVLLSFCNAVGNPAITNVTGVSLMPFSDESKMFHFRPGEGVQGRVWASMRPEWVTGLADPKNFRRADLARRFGLKVCLAVPVTITGKIEGVLCFYDVRHRPYDTQCLELAMRLAWALGNAIGGKRAKVNMV